MVQELGQDVPRGDSEGRSHTHACAEAQFLVHRNHIGAGRRVGEVEDVPRGDSGGRSHTHAYAEVRFLVHRNHCGAGRRVVGVV